MKHRKYNVKRGRRRKNPLGFTKDDATRVLWGAAGYVAARSVPAMALPSQNSGVIGYLLNAGVALALKFIVGGPVGDDLFVGGAIAMVTRIVSDQLGTKVAGLSGDPAFTLGAYWQSYFAVPTVSDPYGRVAVSPYPAPVVAAPAPSTMKGPGVAPGGRFMAGRFGR